MATLYRQPQSAHPIQNIDQNSFFIQRRVQNMNVLCFLTYGISFSPFKTSGQYSLELLSSANLHYACHLQPQSVSRDLLS